VSRVTRVPRGDADIYAALAQLYRAGQIYSFSFERGVWTVWPTQADFDATERNGQVRDPAAAAAGRGPVDWPNRDALAASLGLVKPTTRKPTRAQLVAQLRAVPDLPPAAVAILERAA
jgi:hypothetical protein